MPWNWFATAVCGRGSWFCNIARNAFHLFLFFSFRWKIGGLSVNLLIFSLIFFINLITYIVGFSLSRSNNKNIFFNSILNRSCVINISFNKLRITGTRTSLTAWSHSGQTWKKTFSYELWNFGSTDLAEKKLVNYEKKN